MGLPAAIGGAIGAVASAAAPSLVSGLFNSNSASSQAEKASEAAFEAHKYNIEYMQNKYQWMADDLKKAGINPILAAQSGLGTSTPSASAANIQQAHPIQVGDYSSAKRNLAQAEESRAGATLKGQQALESLQNIAESRARSGKISAEEKLVIQQVFNAEKQFEKLKGETNLLDQEIQLTEKERERLAIVIKGLKLGIEKLIRFNEVYRGKGGEVIAYINAIFGNLNLGAALTGSALMRR